MTIDRIYLVVMGMVAGAAIVTFFHGNAGTGWALFVTAAVMAVVDLKWHIK